MKLALLGNGFARQIVAMCDQPSANCHWIQNFRDKYGYDTAISNFGFTVAPSNEHRGRKAITGHRRASSRAILGLKLAGIDAVSLADDHLLDDEPSGLRSTIQALDAAGIAHSGAGMDMYEACSPAIIDAHGVRIALIACTEGMISRSASVRRPGVHFMKLRGTRPQIDLINALVHRSRRMGADIIVLSLFRSGEETLLPAPEIEDLILEAGRAGVDIVLGYSDSLETTGRDRMIVYDTRGNDDAISPIRVLEGTSLITVLEIGSQRPAPLEVFPRRHRSGDARPIYPTYRRAVAQ